MIDDATRKRIGEGLGALVIKSKGNQIIEDMAALWVAYNALEKRPSLEDVINKCVCEVSLTVKRHNNFYQRLDEFLTEITDMGEIDDELRKRIIALGYVYELQFYPDTPVGFYCVFGTSVDECITKALEIFAREYPGR